MNTVITANKVIALSYDFLRMAMQEFPNGTTEQKIKARFKDSLSEELQNACLAYLTQRNWAHVSGTALFITPSGIETLASVI